jgi:uncharacterized protein (TIGR02246 family)
MEKKVKTLYQKLVSAWNDQDATKFASCFASDAVCIGFDGSELLGKTEIENSLSAIFGDHKTAIYYSLIRDIKMINDNVFMLRANVGMVQPGKSSIEPSKNAIQIMIGRWNNESGEIMLFQNTPAQFHGRPELSEKLTQELNALVK